MCSGYINKGLSSEFLEEYNKRHLKKAGEYSSQNIVSQQCVENNKYPMVVLENDLPSHTWYLYIPPTGRVWLKAFFQVGLGV